jgi:hypothetical protein
MDRRSPGLLGSAPRTRLPIFPCPALVARRGSRRLSLSRRPGVAAGFGLLCLALGWGCSKQGEGERCDTNNFDIDCDTGLICKGEAQLSIKGRGVALCCPRSGPSSVAACQAVAVLPPEPDAGSLPELPQLPELPVMDASTTPEAPVTDASTAPDATP